MRLAPLAIDAACRRSDAGERVEEPGARRSVCQAEPACAVWRHVTPYPDLQEIHRHQASDDERAKCRNQARGHRGHQDAAGRQGTDAAAISPVLGRDRQERPCLRTRKSLPRPVKASITKIGVCNGARGR